MLGAGDVDYMDPNLSYYSVGYLGLRLWSRQLFTYPAVEGTDHDRRAGPGHRDPDHRQRRHQRGRQDLHDHDPPGRASGTPPRPGQVTAEDVVRGVKRTCNPVQPFGGIPDFAT